MQNWLDHLLLRTSYLVTNWPSLNLFQSLREGWTNSYWKRQVLIYYPLGKSSEKPYGGWHPPPSPPSPLYVWGLKCKGVMNMGGKVGRLWRGLLWDTSTRRSHSAQITSPRVVRKSCLIHRFLSPLLHEQIQIHRRYSILEKTCSCNRIKLNYQATKKKIESTRKHRRLGSKFCDRLHYNYVTYSKTKKIH